MVQFQFESLTAFMQMSGHGPYVWFSYLLTFLCLVILLITPVVRQRSIMRDVRRRKRLSEHESLSRVSEGQH